MLKISADYIFPIVTEPIRNGIIILEDDGTIIDVINPSQIEYKVTPARLHQSDGDVKHYNGIICPGFINTHCHLELSHLRGKIPEKTGLATFIANVQKLRKSPSPNPFPKEMGTKKKFHHATEEFMRRYKPDENIILESIINAEKEMINNGIVAVGDISNSALTFELKAKSKIKYHTFIELFGIEPSRSQFYFNRALSLFNKYPTVGRRKRKNVSIVPHSAYSVSRNLLRLIERFATKNHSIQTMHNQESEEENKLFLDKTGEIYDMLLNFGIDMKKWRSWGLTSLSAIYMYLSSLYNMLLVHNIFTRKEDIELAEGFFEKLYWCFCPNSNLYIEGVLPNIPMFVNQGCKITIGTDSLASNHSLSILSEIQTISKHFPNIPLNVLLKWATLNGAEALGFGKHFGSIEKNKKTKIILIDNINVEKCTLTDKSQVKLLNC